MQSVQKEIVKLALNIALTLGVIFLLILGTIVSILVYESIDKENFYTDPSDCEERHLDKVDECSGHTILSRRSSETEYTSNFRAYGNANQEICYIFQDTDFSKPTMPEDVSHRGINTHLCDIGKPDISWMPINCSFAKYPNMAQCYQCEETPQGGPKNLNIGFSEDCTKGAYIYSEEFMSIQ